MATKEEILDAISEHDRARAERAAEGLRGEVRRDRRRARGRGRRRAGGGGGGGAAPAEEEQDEFDVVLTAAGDKKIQVIKEVRALTSLGPEGGQGPRRRRPQARPREGVQGGRREGQGRSSRAPAPPSRSSSRLGPSPCARSSKATTAAVTATFSDSTPPASGIDRHVVRPGSATGGRDALGLAAEDVRRPRSGARPSNSDGRAAGPQADHRRPPARGEGVDRRGGGGASAGAGPAGPPRPRPARAAARRSAAAGPRQHRRRRARRRRAERTTIPTLAGLVTPVEAAAGPPAPAGGRRRPASASSGSMPAAHRPRPGRPGRGGGLPEARCTFSAATRSARRPRSAAAASTASTAPPFAVRATSSRSTAPGRRPAPRARPGSPNTRTPALVDGAARPQPRRERRTALVRGVLARQTIDLTGVPSYPAPTPAPGGCALARSPVRFSAAVPAPACTADSFGDPARPRRLVARLRSARSSSCHPPRRPGPLLLREPRRGPRPPGPDLHPARLVRVVPRPRAWPRPSATSARSRTSPARCGSSSSSTPTTRTCGRRPSSRSRSARRRT